MPTDAAMNPRVDLTNRATLAPLAEVRKNLRIDWYRCPIERNTLRELSQPDDVNGWLHAAGHLSLWVVTGLGAYYCYQASLWPAFFLLLFAQGTIASFFSAPHHELCHGTVFKSKGVGEVFLRVFSVLGWLNFHVYKFSHSYHHRFTLHLEGDREEVMPATPSLRFLYLLQLFTVNLTGGYQSRGLLPTVKGFVRIASGRLDNPFNSWGPELYADHAEEGTQAVRWARSVLGFHALVIALSFGLGEPIAALLISGSVFVANALRYFVGVPMHCGLRSEVPDFRKSVRTISLDPFTEFLYWHMNWHLEHHMFAAVPCYRLRKLHAAVATDMPARRTLLGAWREMRSVWKRQQSEPEYAFDTPLPSSGHEPRHAPGELAAAMGDLAPQALR